MVKGPSSPDPTAPPPLSSSRVSVSPCLLNLIPHQPALPLSIRPCHRDQWILRRPLSPLSFSLLQSMKVRVTRSAKSAWHGVRPLKDKQSAWRLSAGFLISCPMGRMTEICHRWGRAESRGQGALYQQANPQLISSTDCLWTVSIMHFILFTAAMYQL